MSRDKRSDGLLSICYPCGTDPTIPSFSLYYILSVKEYIEHSGDTDIIKDVNPKLLQIINTFLDNMENGLVCKFPDACHWNFYDWSKGADGSLFSGECKEPDVLISILTVLGLESYKEICALCSLKFGFDTQISQLKDNIKMAYFDTGCGLFHVCGDYTELVNALALKANIVDGEKAKVICKSLAAHALTPCSLSMKCFVYDALIKADREGYRSFILEDIKNTYTPMIETGTVWETAEGASAFDNAGSLCHGWSSTPIFYYSLLL